MSQRLRVYTLARTWDNTAGTLGAPERGDPTRGADGPVKTLYPGAEIHARLAITDTISLEAGETFDYSFLLNDGTSRKADVAPDQMPRDLAAPGTAVSEIPAPAVRDAGQNGDTQPSASAESGVDAQPAAAWQAATGGSASGATFAGTGSDSGAGSGMGGSKLESDTNGNVTESALLMPRPISDIRPDYPRAARRAGWEGVVRISALVDDTGVVVSAEIAVSSGHAALDQTALDAVRQTVFAPAVQSGRTVFCRVIVPVRFRLRATP